VRRQLLLRLLVSAALAGTAALAAVGVTGGTAGANPLTVTCPGVTGTAPATWSLSGCAGTAFALTGATGTSVPLGVGVLKITWSTTKTSKVAYSSVVSTAGSCPVITGYQNAGLLKETGKVIAGSAAAMIGGIYKLKACQYANSSGVVVMWVGVSAKV